MKGGKNRKGNCNWTQPAIGNGQSADVTAYATNRLNQYSNITYQSNSLQTNSLFPSYDLNGHQKSVKPKAEPTGDRDFEAARMRGARSRIRRRSGNRHMTWDGTNAYFWDVQNQLILVSNAAVQVASAYDAMGRRVRKTVSRRDAETQSWVTEKTCHFFYDGWNVIAEIGSRSSEVSTNRYVWGNDLSGSLQGAGGVGGLLAVLSSSPNSLQTNSLTASYPLYDHNGNAERYVTRSGATVASFQYDAFGNTVSETLTQSGNNAFTHFRFSTKYWDAEEGLYYYGYRFYRSELGRWVNRDPIGERGGLDLYLYSENNGYMYYDYLGLKADCDYRIVVGHGYTPVPGVNQNQSPVEAMVDSLLYRARVRNGGCGNRIGAVSCYNGEINDQLGKYAIMDPQYDYRRDRKKSAGNDQKDPALLPYTKLLDALESRINMAKDIATGTEACKCCQSITVSVSVAMGAEDSLTLDLNKLELLSPRGKNLTGTKYVYDCAKSTWR